MSKVLLGDCLERMKEIPDTSIDMVLCDPPYGTTRIKWDSVIDLPNLWGEIKRIRKPGAAVVLTGSQPFTTALISSNLPEFRYELIWKKQTVSGFLDAKRKPLKSHENILVFYDKLPTYNPQKTKVKAINGTRGVDGFGGHYNEFTRAKHYSNGGEAYPRSVLEFSYSNDGKRVHPSQKPVSLFEYLIKTFSNEGDTVLDFAAGSGTAAVACIGSNREYILIEKDPAYFEAINNRIAKLPSTLLSND